MIFISQQYFFWWSRRRSCVKKRSGRPFLAKERVVALASESRRAQRKNHPEVVCEVEPEDYISLVASVLQIELLGFLSQVSKNKKTQSSKLVGFFMF